MGLFKRISTTLTASVDNIVTRVENHDAIIEASVKECRQAASRTRIHLNKVQRDGTNLEQQRSKAEEDIELWTSRAVSVAETDEEKALQCLKRKKQSEQALQNLNQSLTKHKEVEKKVRDNLTSIEARITEISQQRNTMRSRQSAAEAMRVLNHIEGDSQMAIEDTFDRWEMNLAETEIAIAPASPADELESEFVSNEEISSLKMELEALVNDKEK